MNVEFKKSFEKDLSKIRDEALLQKIKAVIVEVEKAENIREVSNIKKLRYDAADYYRIRVGDYRIGITIRIACNLGFYRVDLFWIHSILISKLALSVSSYHSQFVQCVSPIDSYLSTTQVLLKNRNPVVHTTE